MTITQLFDAYLASRAGELSDLSEKQIRHTGLALERNAGKVGIARIGAKEADAIKAKLLAEVSPITAMKHVRFARQAWAWAVRMGHAKSNPWEDVRLLVRAKDEPAPVVTSEDIARVMAHCTPDLAAMFALCRWAGLRKSEALHLAWDDVGEKDIRVLPRDGERTTKQARRTVPITRKLAPILERADANEPGPCGQLRNDNHLHEKGINAIEAAGLTPWPKMFQTLRANCESDWLAAGLPVMDVCKWLGHNPRVAMRHYHAVRTSSADALRAL